MRFAFPVLALASILMFGCSSPDGETIIIVQDAPADGSNTYPIQLKEFEWELRYGIWIGKNKYWVMPASEKDLSILLQYLGQKEAEE